MNDSPTHDACRSREEFGTLTRRQQAIATLVKRWALHHNCTTGEIAVCRQVAERVYEADPSSAYRAVAAGRIEAERFARKRRERIVNGFLVAAVPELGRVLK